MKDKNKPYKILELPSWYPPEGGKFVKQQASALRRAGVDVAVAANCPLPWKKYTWRVPFFPHRIFSIYEHGLLTYRCYTRRLPRAESFNTEHWITKTILLCEEYIKEQGKPDLIHVHSSMWGGAAALILKKKYNIPYIITEHRGRFSEMSDENCIRIDKKFRDRLIDIFSNAELIIPVSSLLIPKIKSYLQKDISIKVISNMIDINKFHYIAREKRENFTFINANHFVWLKGYDILLKAFDIVAEKHGNARLLIVGGGFNCHDFKKIWADCKNRDKITMYGEANQEQVVECLAAADCFVLPSRVESQSIAVLEALATGLPAATTEVVPPEVLTEECGFRVPINNAEALAEAMEKIMLNYNSFDKEKISEKTIQTASEENVVSELLNIYNTIIYD